MEDMLNVLAIMRSNYSEFWICAARKRFIPMNYLSGDVIYSNYIYKMRARIKIG